jgi:hypothetical protein
MSSNMRRIVGIVAASVAVLLLAAVAALYWLLSGDGVRSAIEQQAGAWLGQPVTIASARVSLWPRVAISMRQVGIGRPPRVRLAQVDLGASPLALLSRRVEDAEISIRDSRLDLPLHLPMPIDGPGASAGAGPSGPGTTTPTQATPGAATGGFRVVSVSSIVLDNVTLSSQGRELTIGARSALVGSRVLIRELAAESGATSIRSTGTVTFEPSVNADLRIDANRLDVDELLALAGAFLPATTGTSAAGPSSRLQAVISAGTARAAGIDGRRFAATMTVVGSRVALSPLSFELFGGRYSGSIQADIDTHITATLQAKLEGIDVAQVAAFGNSRDTVSGTLSGVASVSGAGRDLSAILAKARGAGNVQVVDGSVRNLGLVRSIVLFFGRPAANAPPATDRYDRLDARFDLASGILRAGSFGLHSADLDAAGTGTLNLEAGTLNGRMNVTLSESLSQQAGTDLLRFTRDGSRVVLPVALGGTLSEPNVTIDVAAALQRGLRNEAERQLKGILDRFK